MLLLLAVPLPLLLPLLAPLLLLALLFVAAVEVAGVLLAAEAEEEVGREMREAPLLSVVVRVGIMFDGMMGCGGGMMTDGGFTRILGREGGAMDMDG